MLTIGICDDEPQQIEYLKRIAEVWGQSKGIRLCIHTFLSAEAFLLEYETNQSFDILLLDIEMGKLSGMELARLLRREASPIQIIFITGYPDFMAEGYDVSAVHYLLKPVMEDRLSKVLTKAFEAMHKAPRSFVFKLAKESVRIFATDIIYAETDGHYILLHAKGGLEYRFRMTVSELMEILDEDFIKCSRSFVVNLKYILRITKSSVFLTDGTVLPLGKGLYEELNIALIRYLRGV